MLDNSDSDISNKVLYFIKKLESHIQKSKNLKQEIEIELIDERFSTSIAQCKIRKHPKQEKMKQYLDSFAAQIILEDYFRKHKNIKK
jgi:RNase H-fold protein (predicted Holliday junction resolvase)